MDTPQSVEADRRFGYHSPADAKNPEERCLDHELVRAACKEAARVIILRCPEGRERSLAITKLEESMMWANAGIARQDAESGRL
jgi:hypothetical protein